MWIVALILLAGPKAAAAEATAIAEISFSNADLEGDISFGNAALHLLEVPKGAGSFQWQLLSANVTVTVTQQTYVEIGRPTDPSDPQGQVEKEPPETTRYHFSNAELNSTSRSAESNTWVSPGNSSWPNLVESQAAVTLTAIAPNYGNDSVQKSRPFHVPPNATWGTADQGALILGGNFSMEIWDAVVTIRNETANQTFESGNRTNGVGVAPPGQPYPVRERHKQTLRLDVVEAILRIDSFGRPASFAAAELTMAGTLTASFHNAQGSLRTGENEQAVSKTVWTMLGALSMQVSNPVANGSLLQALVTGPPEMFGLPALPENGAKEPGSNIAAAKPLETPTWIWIPLGLIGLPWVALAAARRYAPGVTIDDVEWALLEHKPRYAARLARRFLRYHPNDGTGIFLLATALVARKKHQATLRRVEPLALKIKKEERTGTALLLAEAAQRVGDVGRARRWAREAAGDPLLLEEMRANRRLNGLLE